MVGKEDPSSSWGHCQVSNNAQRKFWRSASWSSSRTSMHNPENDDKDSVDPNGNLGNNGVQARRSPAPLTPRSQQNCKGRLFLPPLQPLAITRRSLDEWPKAGLDDIGEWPGPSTPGVRDVNKGGERLKLDMSAIHSNSEKNGDLVKRDKIAFFDKECSKVAEHIYLGGDAVAKNRDILKKNGITHVLNCVGYVCTEYFKTDFVYRTLWLHDIPSEDITSILYDVFDYFEDVREQKGRVFVHCCQGVSRSTSLVIAYLMWREGQSFEDMLQYVKEARGIADPNMGFACQLMQCQKRVLAFPLSPSSLLRVYRIAPHSSYDPLHLVPKMVNDPSLSALDSRGAFIVQVPSAICVWVGKNCEAIMEREARGAVSQIVRYERVQVPVNVIREGEEPSFFWDIFSDFVINKSAAGAKHGDYSSAKIQPGERRVDLYDVDFNIVQKAIEGGFVPPIASSATEHETHLPARENCWSTLRRKFASGHTECVVSAPKSVINGPYSDYRLNNGRNSIVLNQSYTSKVALVPSSTLSSPSSLSLASISSSSSPPYLSPDSISTDSTNSSKCLSESPLESPVSLSSTISSFSNISLLSSKTSTSLSKHPDYIEVNFASQPIKSTTLPSRRSPVSLAECRGSLSKCLKLPIVADSQNYFADQQDDDKMNDITCISFELEKGGKIADLHSNLIDHGSEKLASNTNLCDEESDLTIVCTEFRGEDSLSETEKRNPSTGVFTMVSMNYKPEQPSFYRLPNLEKISVSGACGFDSSSAIVVMPPRTLGGSTENTTIYLRVGRSFNFDKTQVLANGKVGDVELTDWSQVGSDVLSRMGLPMDTNIKIVKEGEEPADFLEVLSILKQWGN